MEEEILLRRVLRDWSFHTMLNQRPFVHAGKFSFYVYHDKFCLGFHRTLILVLL